MGHGNKKTFFITGATGFLGEKLLKLLITKNPEAHFKILIHKTKLQGKSPNLEQISISLFDQLNLESCLKRVDTVIHLAGLTRTSRPKDYLKVNTEGTKSLALAAQRAGVRKFIFISSRAITTDCGPYAESKLRAENELKLSGISYLILRFSEIYDKDSREGIGTLIKLVKKLPIILYPAGNILLSPLFIDDAIKAIINLTEDEAPINKTYLLAGPQTYSLKKVIILISKRLDRQLLLIPIPALFILKIAQILSFFKINLIQPDQISRLTCQKDCDIETAQKEFSFNPISFEEGLAKLNF